MALHIVEGLIILFLVIVLFLIIHGLREAYGALPEKRRLKEEQQAIERELREAYTELRISYDEQIHQNESETTQ